MKVVENCPLGPYTTFGVGGPARALIEVRSIEEMKGAYGYAADHHLSILHLGKGSNSLVADEGFDGLVIVNRIEFLHQEDDQVYVGAGYSFSLLGLRTARAGWSGLEFASGIPGSVGGAVAMNAGANGQETADSLVSVEVVQPDGTLHSLDRKEIDFGYRHSPFQTNGAAVVSATFALTACESARSDQLQILHRRKETQPLWEKSAGCMFRNPDGASAGKLIEAAGLKGMAIGDAVVSDLHANFIVNRGQATSAEIRALIDQVKARVYEASGHKLREEVRYIQSEGKS